MKNPTFRGWIKEIRWNQINKKSRQIGVSAANPNNWINRIKLIKSNAMKCPGLQIRSRRCARGVKGRCVVKHLTGRLSSATVGTITTIWAYDANGNRIAENGATIASYDSQDKLQSWKGNTYQYNQAGDLTQKRTVAGTASYGYDSQGNLRSVTLENGKSITYGIDAANRRTGKRVNGVLQWQLVWMDSLRPLARLKGDNTLDETYYYGDKPNVPEAMTASDGKTYRIVSDQNGSVRLVIDADTGAVVQQMDYDVWGNVINDTNPGFQPFGFAGGLYDPDTKLTRFGARDYDAETGRWTVKDPILFNGGDSNLYGYVLGNPVNFIDPQGLDVQICCRPAEVAGGLVDHCWVKTDTISAGMGANPNIRPGQQYEGYGMPVQITDHSKDTPTSCTRQNNVDEQCVNSKLIIGKPIGRFLPPLNQCQSFAYGTVNSCRTGPQTPAN